MHGFWWAYNALLVNNSGKKNNAFSMLKNVTQKDKETSTTLSLTIIPGGVSSMDH